MPDDDLDSTGYAGEQQGQQQGNPAWSEFLQVVPQELHSQITPVLQKWDSGVNEKLQKVHSEYEPWKPIIKSADPEQATAALNMLNALQESPRMVYDALAEAYGFNTADNDSNGSQSGQGQNKSSVDDDPYNQRFADLERQNHIMAQHLISQREEQLRKQAEVELDQELSGLRNKYKSQGEFDERFVLALMQNGLSSEDAVKEYYSWRDQEVSRYGPKPFILGSGGGLPQKNVDVTKMSDQETKDLAVQYLRASAAERNR
jgi:hypothetical protein